MAGRGLQRQHSPDRDTHDADPSVHVGLPGHQGDGGQHVFDRCLAALEAPALALAVGAQIEHQYAIPRAHQRFSVIGHCQSIAAVAVDKHDSRAVARRHVPAG